ncbi:MAG: C-terminal binding protein [Dehalococcoidales bacterium]|nr:C-terminal binding protein [Dehalococcoidales bacterium]
MENKFKVLRVDTTGSSAIMIEEAAELAKINVVLAGVDADTEDEIIRKAQDADVILTGAAQMTRRVMESLPKCKAIVRYGIGFDTVDVDAATDNKILVINIPDFCFEEVSNHAIALLLACAKKLVFLNNGIKKGEWIKSKQAMQPMGSVYGQTLGLIGCGNIGRMTAKKAQCFSLELLGYDPYVDKSLAKKYGIRLVSLPELLKKSDFVSAHTPLNKETWHMISEEQFKQMKLTAYIINTARGSVIDESALIKALENNLIAGAGLDVFEQEPIDPENPLLKMENVTVLPHSASYSDIAFKRLRTNVGEEASRVISGHWPKNVVNKSVKPKVNLVKEN